MVCIWINSCPLRRLEEQKVIGNKWKKEYCLSDTNWNNCRRYQLEKSGIEHPDNLLPNNELAK